MKKKKKVLIVDDVELNRAFLRDMLEDEYEVIEAANGLEAIERLECCALEIAVVLLDAVMPEMDGFEVLEFMNKTHWIDTIPVIMISADTSPEFISKGYQLGAIDYISRPYSTDIVMHRVKNTILLYAKQILLQSIVTEQIREMQDTNSFMVDILSTLVEFRNGESGMHVRRIRFITEILLEALTKQFPKYNFTASEISEISNAAALHDVGKIAISDEILSKPSKLTAEEFEIIKSHSEKGAKMLENIHSKKHRRMLMYATNICRWHHERWNGKGYPDGLVGDDIPICAQVVAIADVYDTLVSKRVYRPAYPQEQAIQMILDGECGAFHPDLLDCFLHECSMMEEKIQKYEKNQHQLVDVGKIPKEMIENKAPIFSSRTVALLEQERIKNQFFSSLSNEIQFEYEILTDTLLFSDKGAMELGIPLKIKGAMGWLKTDGIIQKSESQKIFKLVRNATIDEPIIQTQFLVLGKDKISKWFEATIRVLWSEDFLPHQCGCIGKMVDIHQQKVEEELLKAMAECDPLTQLYNHATAKKKIQEKLGQPGFWALLFFDIDDFKSINDTYGHLIGDSVLKQFAEIILTNTRATDVAARMGGDEFIIFVNGFASREQLNEWIERLWSVLRVSHNHIQFTVSMGIVMTKQLGTDYDQLLSQADQSLYHAKNQGKNQYAFYTDVESG